MEVADADVSLGEANFWYGGADNVLNCSGYLIIADDVPLTLVEYFCEAGVTQGIVVVKVRHSEI